LALNPEWVSRLLVASGRRLKWRDIRAHPHGWLYGEPRFGDLADVIVTDDKKVHAAPDPFLRAVREALAKPVVTDETFPLLLVNKRAREAMNSWLNESPGLFAVQRTSVVEVHPQDAAATGVRDGDMVRLASSVGSVDLRAKLTEAMRPGVVCVPHGWGSRVFDPVSGAAPESFGVNRNALVSNARLDPFSQVPAFNSTAVRLEPATRRDPAPLEGEVSLP
jgi:formate dehydrogenase